MSGTVPKVRGRPFAKGNRLGGRKKLPFELIAAVRAVAPEAVAALIEIIAAWRAGSRRVTAADAARASVALLDRGYGTAPQSVRFEAAVDPEVVELSALTTEQLFTFGALYRTLHAPQRTIDASVNPDSQTQSEEDRTHE